MRAFSTATGLALAVLLSACGGSSTPPTQPTPTPTPTPAPPSVVSTGGGALASGFVGRPAPFTTSVTGTLLATVDWTFATNDVDVFIARGDCTPQQFLSGACNIGAFSDSATAKPERVTLSGAPPGTYTLLIANTGSRDESLSWQVVLTPTASSASAETPVTGLPLPGKVQGLRATDPR